MDQFRLKLGTWCYSVRFLQPLAKSSLGQQIIKFVPSSRFLGELNLSYNNLNSSLPEEIGNILPLEWLDLTSNSLTGEIPESWENLVKLSKSSRFAM